MQCVLLIYVATVAVEVCGRNIVLQKWTDSQMTKVLITDVTAIVLQKWTDSQMTKVLITDVTAIVL